MMQELPITVPIPMNMVNTNTVLDGNFRSLDRLQEFINDPVNPAKGIRYSGVKNDGENIDNQ